MAAAIALRCIGWSATVLERRSTLGEIGAGMSQAPNAMRTLDALGVGDQARSVGVPFYGPLNLRTPSGRYLVRAASGVPAPLLGFHRADLHRVLLDTVPEERVRSGTEATAARSTGDAATVTAGEEELTADLVIAADGANSTQRRQLWPDSPPPRFLRYTVWRGIARAEGVEGVEGGMTMGRGGYFLAMPVGRGRVYWALGARADRPEVRYDDEFGELTRRLAGWHDGVQALLEATPPEAVLHHDISALAPLSTYVKGRVALLGDAAHAMSPDLGQGAGQAIEDAAVLAASLADTGDIDAALARYDRERRPRSQFVAEQARKNAEFTLSNGRLGYGLRTAMMTMIPSSRWPQWSARSLSQLWDWTPPILPSSPRDRQR